MATSKEYLMYVLDQLADVDGISFHQMMGEYILYHHGKIAAYLCDNRMLAKPVPSAHRLMPDALMEAPYPGAKEMLLVDQTDDRTFLAELFASIYDELPSPKPRKSKKQR